MSQDLLIERLFELLVSGDRAGTNRLIEDALDDGLTVESLTREAYQPLVRMINALNRAEQLTNAAHSYATRILDTLVDDVHQREGAVLPEQVSDFQQPEPAPAVAGSRWTLRRDEDQSESAGFSRLFREPRPADSHRRSQFVTFTVVEGVLTARLAGPSVGERETPIISSEVSDVIQALGPRLKRLVLDLTDVQVMSSMALGMCLDLRAAAKSHGAKTSAIGMTGDMARVFRRLRISSSPSSRPIARFFSRSFAAA